MDTPNAFIGKATQPTVGELSAALGPTTTLWNQLVDSLCKEQAGICQEWHSLRPKYGWTLLLKLKKRRIVYLGPRAGCFLVAFILGDKAMAAARESSLSKPVLKLLDEAPHYAEGTGIRLTVKNAKDLPTIRKLAKIKLEN
jgi:hypothetical protein